MIPRREILLAFTISLIGILGGYLAGFGMLSSSFLVALESYLLLLFFIATILLRSFRHAFYVVFSAFLTVLYLSILHIILLPSFDTIAQLSYFLILLLSYLLNLFFIYDYDGKEPLFRVYRKKKPAIASILVSFMLISLLISTQEELFSFGMLSLVGAALSYLILIFFFSSLIKIEKYIKEIEKPTEEEIRVRKFVRKYGKGKDVYPFYATWLGTAVSRVEEIIDSLEAKGYLGHNFFSFHNPFFWFICTLSFALGADSAGGSFLHALPLLLFFLLGISLLGPQTFLDRNLRRSIGLLFLLAGLLVLYLKSIIAFKIAATASLLALISIYFAYKDDEVVSIIFASFFVGSLYLLAYSLFKPPVVHSPHPWLITFAVFALLIYDLYVREESY